MATNRDCKRAEFSHRHPCFHCSRSLAYIDRDRKRVWYGFALFIDGIERVFHNACIDRFFSESLSSWDMTDEEVDQAIQSI